MRVLVVTAFSPTYPTDGDSLILAHQLHELAGRHEVLLLSAQDGAGDVPAGGPLPTSIEVRTFGAEQRSPVDIIRLRAIGWRRREPAHAVWVEQPRLLAALPGAIASFRPDLVYLFGWGTAQLVEHCGAVPAVHMPVDCWSGGVANRGLPGWRRLTEIGQAGLVRRHEAHWYPRCRSVLVVSPGERDRVLAVAPGATVEVVTNGVDAGPDPVDAPAAEPATLVFHGSLGTNANLEAARHAATAVLPKVRAKVPDTRLLLVGRGAGPEIEALAAEPGVVLVGPVDDVPATLRRAGVYAATMVSGTGIKNKVLEAMAAGVPVVATRLALDGIGDGPGVVRAATDDAFADAVVAWLADPVAARAAGRAGWQRVQASHSWAGSVATLERVWVEAVAGRG